MEHILLVIHVLIAAALIGMVLLQRSDTDGFGMGSGGGSGLLSGRAQANLLTRTTAILAALFIANSLLLSVLASNHRQASIVDTIEKQQAKEAFSAPVVPNAGEDKTTKETVTKKETVKKTDKTAKPEVPVDTGAKQPQAVEKSIAPEKPVVVKATKKPAAKATDDESGDNNAE